MRLCGRIGRTILSDIGVNEMINEYRVDQMTDEQLCRYYKNHQNLTLDQLSEITGRSLQALKALLLGQTK